VGDFTPDQQAIIEKREQTYLHYIKSLHDALEEYGYRISAIANVLYSKGLTTSQELDAAEQEIRAALMIEKAVNPEIRRAEETLRRILGA
jgi:hypothetical protein